MNLRWYTYLTYLLSCLPSLSTLFTFSLTYLRTYCGYCPYVWQRWKDYRLSWNITEYGGVDSIRLPSNLVWTPDILLYNRCVAYVAGLAIEVGGGLTRDT